MHVILSKRNMTEKVARLFQPKKKKGERKNGKGGKGKERGKGGGGGERG